MHRVRFTSQLLIGSLLCTSVLGLPSMAAGQLVMNEANAVGDDDFIQTDEDFGCEKPYEGYDFGIMPYSGNTNSVVDPNPGNPFPPDVNNLGNVFDPGTGLCTDPTPETTLPNGWNLENATGWGRIQGNGGDWLELVVTRDHTDLRGYTIYWENDDDFNLQIGTNPDERGFIKFTDNKSFANLRAGTIITLSESAAVNENRDEFPVNLEFDAGGPDPHNTGHVYDLTTDLSFDPFDGEDWHVHYHVDESLTDIGLDTEYFEGFSDVKVDNDQWQLAIFDSTNTAIVAEAEDDSVTAISDLTTGLVQGIVGEAGITGVSVNNQEMLTLRADPSDNPAANTTNWEDVDFSTFGTPNIFNDQTESTLDGVQDFSALRNPVLAGTHDWVATGTADVGNAANWVNAASGAAPGAGPSGSWTMRLNNSAGDARVAQVSTDTTVEFASVMATSGSMTLEVQSGATLTAAGNATPGRVLVMDGGTAQVDGTIVASAVEAFMNGTVNGGGVISGDLLNTGGIVQPGSGNGGTLSVAGNYVQDELGTLMIDINGAGAGDFSVLQIDGVGLLGGFADLSLNGSLANGTSLVVATAAGGLTDMGLSLTGDTSGFSFSIENGTDLVLSFMGSLIDGDFNNDGNYDCADIDLLTGEIAGGGNNGDFDLTGDGNVDLADRDAWLAEAGAENLASGNAYLLGDANLDGVVDGQDFIAWNGNKFTNNSAWCGGDFNADGVVDGQDFIAWNGNKFTSADGVNAVPEPAVPLGTLLLIAAWFRRRP